MGEGSNVGQPIQVRNVRTRCKTQEELVYVKYEGKN